MKDRKMLERVLLAVGMVAVAAGLLVAYVHDTLSDSEEFADSAEQAYRSPEVHQVLTNAVVDQIIDAAPELVAVQPLLESIVDGAFRSDAATGIVNAGVADLHRTVFAGDTDTLTVQLADLILVAKTQLTTIDPELGALIPDELTDGIIVVNAEPMLVDVVQAVDDLGVLAFLVPMIAIAVFVAAVWVAESGSDGLVRVGLATVLGAILALVVERLARAVVVGGDALDQAVAESIWDAFVAELGTWILVLAGIGAVVASVAWFGVGGAQSAERSERMAALFRRRTSKRGRVLWGLAAVIIGFALIVEWKRSLQFIVTVVGAALVATGVREVFAVVAPGLIEGANAPRSQAPDPEVVLEEQKGGRWLGTAVLVVAALLALLGVWRSGGSGKATEGATCNGSEAPCGLRLDEVVLAATHNSHAAAEEGFLRGYQRAGLAAQLEQGIRALLVDVYFGREVDNVVITDRAPLTEEERAELVTDVGEGAVRSAEATAARSEAAGIERELFLCHALCEIGATPFLAELGTINRFLADNPRELVVIIIQDEGPAPEDIVDAFAKSGLDKLVHTQPLGEEWPTLGELIELDTRLIVFAENNSGGVEWYHDAFTYVQDTPFSFESIEDFSCEPNRGEPESELFLVNHWLSPVSPTAAEQANEASVLTERFEQCQAERGQLPNMIAVDFYSAGDLVETVAALNE